ncbi:beta-ketoacyl synthase, partial [Providencia rettgeri]
VIPAFYHPGLPAQMPTWAYAVALLFEAGDTLQCSTESDYAGNEMSLPQSLRFLRHYLAQTPHFTIDGERVQWRWSLMK